MGLFDFIKTKLFGKSKKVEESKTSEKDSKKIVIKSPEKVEKKVEKSKVEKKKDKLKKDFFAKLKPALIDKPKKEEEPEVEDDDKETESLKKGLEKTKKSFCFVMENKSWSPPQQR